jgi:glyoxylase-like metal-dependent hydrolase (beta-lactamase superfamily II)
MQFDCLPVTRAEQNCSILWCPATRHAAVIDPGGDLYQLDTFLELSELTLELVLVTHAHVDHAGGAAKLAATTGARLEGPHRGDEHLARNLAAQGRRLRIPAADFTPSRWLEDNDEVRFGRETMSVLHCPGHSRGHVAYFHAGRRHAFVGDILFRHAIGAWEHADGDLKQLVHSIRDKLFALGDDVSFTPGHGATSTFGHERIHNPFVGETALRKWRDGEGPPPHPGGHGAQHL